MKVYTYGSESYFPLFMFVYGKRLSYYDTLRVKSGPLSKWSFRKVSAKVIKIYYEEYEGDFPSEVKIEAIRGIFSRKTWS